MSYSSAYHGSLAVPETHAITLTEHLISFLPCLLKIFILVLPSWLVSTPLPKGYIQYIKSLPLNDMPEIFGLHDNANITFAQNETYALLAAIIQLQPKTSAAGGQSREEVCKLVSYRSYSWEERVDKWPYMRSSVRSQSLAKRCFQWQIAEVYDRHSCWTWLKNYAMKLFNIMHYFSVFNIYCFFERQSLACWVFITKCWS